MALVAPPEALKSCETVPSAIKRKEKAVALIPCPTCGQQVSKRAPTCPGCGHPITGSPPAVHLSSGSGGSGWLLALLLLGGGAFFLFKTDTGKQLFDAGRRVTDAQRILGKWKQQDGPLALEFFSDGTLREERLLNNGSGTYKLLPNRRIELKIDGVLWGQNEGTMRYEISGDELVLTSDGSAGLALRYRKVN
jgi:hypothetical protein